MAQKIIDTTTPQPNGKIGDTAKVAFGKINDNFTELFNSLNGKAAATHTHEIAKITGLQAALDGKAAATHTHGIADVSGLQAALRGYIDGLRMEWVSGTSLRVTGGAAYVPGLNGILGVESPITKSGLSLAANTWYHLYLYRNGGSADIEISATDPAAPYSGAARTKTGDSTRRYIGSIRTVASGEVVRFRHNLPGSILYSTNINLFRVLANGTKANPPANISLTDAIPVTSRVARVVVENGGTNAGTVAFSNPDLTTTDVGAAILFFLRSTGMAEADLPTSEGRQINYAYLSPPAAGVGASVWVVGYSFER